MNAKMAAMLERPVKHQSFEGVGFRRKGTNWVATVLVSLSVLVVEDDPRVLSATVDALEELGIEDVAMVGVAKGGPKAVATEETPAA